MHDGDSDEYAPYNVFSEAASIVALRKPKKAASVAGDGDIKHSITS